MYLLTATIFIFNYCHSLPIIDNDFNNLGNYLPKYNKYDKGDEYSDRIQEKNNIILRNHITIKSSPKTMNAEEIFEFVKDGAIAGYHLVKDVAKMIIFPKKNRDNATSLTNNSLENTTKLDDNVNIKAIDPISQVNVGDFNDTFDRQIRQEEEEEEEEGEKEEEQDTTRIKDMEIPNNSSQQTEFGEDEDIEDDDDDDRGGGGNMITGLISAFLGSLSRPDGGIDIDAITALLGSLSTQNDDGSYNFQGITDILMGLFGGGEDGGGSDFGAFIGGLVGALLKGVVNPPGAKGAGIFAGNFLGQIIPALSGPTPPKNDNEMAPQGLDIGGFITGLLSSMFGASSSGGSNNANTNSGVSKFPLIKGLFSLITSIFSSSSSSS